MARPFWLIVWGVWIGIAGSGLILVCLSIRKFRHQITFHKVACFLRQLIRPMYRLSWQEFVESNLRATTGQPLDRPFGTARHYFNWEKIQFNPGYLTQLPSNSPTDIGTAVILGPAAPKPLHLKMPILIGAMSYGNALSLDAKLALAKGATQSGTATCSGNGPFLGEERQAAGKYIFQYSRGFWSKTESVFRQSDLIEIGLGHGAWVSAPVRIKGQKINPAFANRLSTIPGLDVLIEARLPGIDDPDDWKALIAHLKEVSGGAPIGVKFGLSHDLEKELAFMLAADIDVLTFDGLEGGTHGCPPLLLDDIGLPTFPGLCRAIRFLEEKQYRERISVVVGGGLTTPGDFAKCLALGADAVIIGTIAALTMSHTQVAKTVPWEPPTGLIFFEGKETKKFNPDLGAYNLSNYLDSCVKEMKLLAAALGKSRLQDLNKTDLVALDPLYAKIAGIESIPAIPSQRNKF